MRQGKKRGRPHDNPKTDASVRNLIRLKRREGTVLRLLAEEFNLSTAYVQRICAEPEESEVSLTKAKGEGTINPRR